jgi:hypothetical protein
MNITWKVAYSGRTPLKNGLLEFKDLLLPSKLNMSQSDHGQALSQNQQELAGTLYCKCM